ncbi:ATP-dependent RNA helicase dbp7 [Coemansia nantahalensis]|uniref:ATP-dependent RNA helicase dbp7 n=1 Tax=Coemansia nantahalensis TaxID=2789366 RepID=A0ACC1K2Q7_9FUNG|nr:ATP-dependent RNA helicase dbp7 [Coemansia nantahalensis]
MADDDGLFLNLGAGAGPARTVVPANLRPKGGRWKDRMAERQLLKSAVWQAQRKSKAQQGARPAAGSAQKSERPAAQAPVDADGGASARQRPRERSGATGPGSKQVMSSLFTKNPEIPTVARTGDQENRVSSNAVLDTSSFEGIGLDDDMRASVAEKMGIVKPTAIQQNAIPVLIGKPILGGAAAAAGGGDAFDVEREVSVEHDVFIQAATGSGKTLAYLLPIFHRLIRATALATSGAPASRSLGTFAIVLTPTRELAQQVVETALPLSHSAGRNSGWIVPGMVIGGEKKQSEKSRLRKGIPLLACTPGRLLDHLENTKSFVVDHLRWLVLDEADRLLELGFAETLEKILALLDEKARNKVRVLGHRSVATSLELPRRRINVLCSATLRDNVKRLANESLHSPKFVSATSIHDSADQAASTATGDSDTEMAAPAPAPDAGAGGDRYSLPSQLVQRALIVPAKLRLVTLVAQLRNTFRRQPASKVIVFLLCKDSVDFMYFLLAHGGAEAAATADGKAYADDLFDALGDDGAPAKPSALPGKSGPTLREEDISLESSVVPGVDLYRLHGSMAQKRRTETFLAFSRAQSASVLFTTDVAARGLDLPNVTSIVQFDPPADIPSYLHRVGRTARLGRAGEASLFLLPSETKYLDVLAAKGLRPDDETMESVLKQMAKNTGARKAVEWQLRAGEVQSRLEQFVLSSATASGLAKQAYLSSIRAYATHVSAERHIFHVRFLHFGHLAKAFALREAPTQVASGKGNNTKADDARKDRKDRRDQEQAARKKPTFKRANDISEFAVGDVGAYFGPRAKRTRDAGSDSDA